MEKRQREGDHLEKSQQLWGNVFAWKGEKSESATFPLKILKRSQTVFN